MTAGIATKARGTTKASATDSIRSRRAIAIASAGSGASRGAISATILLSSHAGELVDLAGLIAVIVAVVAICLVTFIAAGAVERFLGDTGRILLTRLLGTDPITCWSYGAGLDTEEVGRCFRGTTDIGGMMSHAAIVCREYGLPAVTGTGNASSKIKTGMRLRVDGNTGSVHILG